MKEKDIILKTKLLVRAFLMAYAQQKISVSLQYDVDYGIEKRSGWTFVIEGVSPSPDAQFVATPELAMLLASEEYENRQSKK